MRDQHPRRTLARFAGHLSLDTGHNRISVGAGSSTLIMRRVSKLASPQKLWKLATCRASVFVKFFTGKAAPPASLRHIIPNSAVGIATKRRNRHKTKAFEARCRSGSSSSGGEAKSPFKTAKRMSLFALVARFWAFTHLTHNLKS